MEVNAALRVVLARSRELGFLGPGPWEQHWEHAQSFLGAVEGCSEIVDLGSGGGVPGLVLLALRRDLHVTLVDAMQKRCRFLEWAVDELQAAGRTRVLCGRAEELARVPAHRGAYDAVVARSFGPPAVTAECAVGFLRLGGRLVVSEPPEAEDRWPADGLAQLGLAAERRLSGAQATLQTLVLTAPVDGRFPRRAGIPAKRPLF